MYKRKYLAEVIPRALKVENRKASLGEKELHPTLQGGRGKHQQETGQRSSRGKNVTYFYETYESPNIVGRENTGERERNHK